MELNVRTQVMVTDATARTLVTLENIVRNLIIASLQTTVLKEQHVLMGKTFIVVVSLTLNLSIFTHEAFMIYKLCLLTDLTAKELCQ